MFVYAFPRRTTHVYYASSGQSVAYSVQQKAVSSLLWLVNYIKLAPSGEQAALLSGISGCLLFCAFITAQTGIL